MIIEKLRAYIYTHFGIRDAAIIETEANAIRYPNQCVYVIGNYNGKQYIWAWNLERYEFPDEFDIFTHYKDPDDEEVHYLYNYKDVFVGSVTDVLYKRVILGCDKFYSYNDIDSSDSSTMVACSTPCGIVYGGSHRAFSKFVPGTSIIVEKDSLLLSHGYVEGCDEYEKEKEQIERVKQMIEGGMIYIKDIKTALFLAYRLAEASG